jgi:hypothetical protein
MASLRTLASRSRTNIETILVEIELTRPSEWFTLLPTPGEFGISTGRDDRNCVIRLIFGPEFFAQSTLAENRAERQLVQALLEQVCGLLGVPVGAVELAAIVNEHAPLGVKRRFSVMGGITPVIIDTGGLPRVRKVQSFDDHVVSDLLGSHLGNAVGYAVGGISDDDRPELCKASVKFLYEHLKSLVAELSNTGLLQQLIARHESLIADRRLLDVIMATHLACFGNSDKNLEEYQNDIIRTDQACIASRFVIEYVAARPSGGHHAFSISAYDRLIATASQITYYGQVSDSMHYKLSRHSFELLKSGRLASSDPQFETAIAAFQEAFCRRLTASCVEEYRNAMKAATNDLKERPPREVSELEDATATEFGLPISQLGTILAAIANSPFTSVPGFGECDKDGLLTYLSSELFLDRAVVASALDLFTLGARTEFLRPGKPHCPADVYPWRFNRGLSYLRRPLIADNAKLLWGRRAILQAAGYLLGLCTTGRLKNVRTQEMRRYQGEIVNRLGDWFNERVAQTLADSGRFVVRKRVKKVNGKRLTRDSGEVLGDVDVLAAERIRRRILSIEAKCLSLAKTPADLANERDELFGNLENRTGAIGRHIERTEWLRAHLSDVLKELRIDPSDSERWSVAPLLVVDSDLVSARLTTPPFPIVSLADMLREV